MSFLKKGILSLLLISFLAVPVKYSSNFVASEITDIRIIRQFVENERIIVLEPYNEEAFIVDRTTNTIYIGAITEELIGLLEREAFIFDALGKKNITMKFHSPGGSLTAMKAIIIQLKIMQKKGFHITMVVDKNNACMSACTAIFFQGDKRIAHEDSVFMFHSPYWTTNQRIPESLKILYNIEMVEERIKFIKMLHNTCPENEKLKQDILDRKNHFYTPDGLAGVCNTIFTEIKRD